MESDSKENALLMTLLEEEQFKLADLTRIVELTRKKLDYCIFARDYYIETVKSLKKAIKKELGEEE